MGGREVDDDEYGFGSAWVEAEEEAARGAEITIAAIKRYNAADDIVDSATFMQDAQMALLNNLVLEVRALRMFMVARFGANDEELT